MNQNGHATERKKLLGLGPAIRVPNPAAGSMTKTCMTRRVYNAGLPASRAGYPFSTYIISLVG